MKKTIVITGGHVTPAVAVIQELLKRGSYAIHFYGRKYAFLQAKNIPSFEYESITGMNIPFTGIGVQRFPGWMSKQTIPFTFQFLKTIFESYLQLRKHTPDCILSFGGYVAAPVILAGWLLRIPVFLHEQTLVAGKANRWLSYIAKNIFVSWEETTYDFPQHVQNRCILAGNPVRKEIREVIKKKKQRNRINTIYITGGATGAHRINTVIEEALPELTAGYTIIHQCGDSHYHDFERLRKRDEKNYELHRYIPDDLLATVLQRADILIGRAGANTIVELVLLGMPSILIPLPESSGKEQMKQAEMIESHHAGILISQHELTPHRLMVAIKLLAASMSSYQNHAEDFSKTEAFSLHKTAHKTIVDHIELSFSGNWHLVSEDN